MQLMITASPDDPSEVSLTAGLQPPAQTGLDYSEQSMSVSPRIDVVVVTALGLTLALQIVYLYCQQLPWYCYHCSVGLALC